MVAQRPASPRRISLIIPALNEAECIGPLLAEVPSGAVHEIIVVDNGSTDGTGAAAQTAGAQVVREDRRGYGYACAAGAAAAGGDLLAFMDGDGSFVPAELSLLAAPLQRAAADMSLGSRLQAGDLLDAMPAHQLLGNRFVAWILNRRFGLSLTDLGPFRVIRRDLFLSLEMQEFTYGWPVEMIVKAARRQARILEVPVTYRKRFAGRSKVGGTVRGTLLAAYRFSRVIVRYAF